MTIQKARDFFELPLEELIRLIITNEIMIKDHDKEKKEKNKKKKKIALRSSTQEVFEVQERK